PIPYVARHDGSAWADISPPSNRTIQRIWQDKAGSIWLQAEQELLRRRGGAWEKMAPPRTTGELAWTAQGPDDTLWVRYGEEVFHLDAKGAWEKAVLPKDGNGKRYVAERVLWHEGETLIVARGEDGGALLGTKKPDEVLDRAAPEGAPAKPHARQSAF